ncbi:multidrug resistance protein MdtA precursor [Desulfosporosinus acididurans]|uniref:Multidrug resistance protein MdtA n=1 Tax=Desulfosporosinus acididurans TaxID=476652 RepID=A0A0J1FSW9_9FIRM|nr:efflux RND transporter periplasmic adaptor subunit [Desulfosporosinus acididurans]KLU66402.1 multidrug resistance protein MdtA precursor [Desulfosporosinus acididurans]
MLSSETIKRHSKVLIIGLLITSLTGCGTKTAASPNSRGQQAIPVQTAPVQTGDLNSINTLTGTVVSNLQTNIGSKSSGRVLSVDVNMGQDVHKGQVLATLDPSDLQRQLSQNQAQLQVDQAQLPSDQATYQQAQSDFQRYQTLFNNGAVSKADLDQYRLKMTTASAKIQMDESVINKDQAALSITQQQIDELTITSPVDGTVSTKNVEIGEQVSTSSNLFSIVQPSSLNVSVNVPEQMIGSIKQGTAASITLDGQSSNAIQGKVSKISPAMDSVSRAYPVQIDIASQNQTIKPGMTVTVQFNGLKSQPGIIIPVQAVVETTQGSEVFAVNNSVAHMHLIQLGAVNSDKAVVTSGLKAGENLVIAGQDLLSDGSNVRVVQSADQAGVNGLINQQKQSAQGAKK